MKVKCTICKKYRFVKVNPKHESLDCYTKRRPYCIKCGHKNRIKTLGGHAPNWKGGWTIDQEGYARVWIDGVGYKKEHRVVWERHHGKIPKGYVIHHLDENKLNNQIANLQCLLKRDHDKMNKSLLLNHWNRRLASIKSLL